MAEQFDLVILGSGSTAFAAALAAQEMGKTAVMTEERSIGGTCVNRGCLPSKNLIEAAKLLHDAAHPRYPGLKPCRMDLDFSTLVAQKDEVVHGYIALELGQMFRRFGTDVTILERNPQLLAHGYEPEVRQAIGRVFSDEGIQVIIEASVNAVRQEGNEIVATASIGGVQQEYRAERLLVATGRRLNTDDIAIERSGMSVNERGEIEVDEYLRTSVSHIFAGGDVIGRQAGSQMATPVGSQDGGIAARNAFASGEMRPVNHRVIPRCKIVAISRYKDPAKLSCCAE